MAAKDLCHVVRCSKITNVAVSELMQIFAEAAHETETWNGNTLASSYVGDGLACAFEQDRYGRFLSMRMGGSPSS